MHYLPARFYYVYIVTNRSKTLYIGVTNNLERRIWEHKHAIGSEFTRRYKLDRLVYFERFGDVRGAIDREKQLKGLLRIKKIALIVSMNPAWQDLSEEWFKRHQVPAIGMHRCFVSRSVGLSWWSSEGHPVLASKMHGSFASLRMTGLVV